MSEEIMEGFAQRLTEVDRSTLTPLVCRALGRPDLEVQNWSYELLGGGFGHWYGVAGVYRFRGTAHVPGESSGETLIWSLVLKALARANAYESAQGGWNFWQREAMVYRSGLLADLPPGIAAPRCYAVTEPTEEEIWIWLEDVEGEQVRPWTVERYGLAAYHLGQFNGAYLRGRPLPPYSWLTEGPWPELIAQAAVYFDDLATACSLPVLAAIAPPATQRDMATLWSRREELLTAVNRLPACFCHHDIFRRNLLSRTAPGGATQTLAIDWAFAGRGVVGEEAARLVITSLALLDIPIAQAPALDAAVFAQYADGLVQAGWRGTEVQLRLGYTAAAALLGLRHLHLDFITFHNLLPYEVLERIFGHPVEEIVQQHHDLYIFALGFTEEALALSRQVSAR